MKEKRKRTPQLRWFVAVLATLAMYPLSMAPVANLWLYGYVNIGVLDVYLPLHHWLIKQDRWLQDSFAWYDSCWSIWFTAVHSRP